MKNPQNPALSAAFDWYEFQLRGMATYLTVMANCIVQHPKSQAATDPPGPVSLFVEGGIVMAVAHYEDFLKGLLTSAMQSGFEEVRRKFLESGSPTEKQIAQNATRPQLIELLRRRVLFGEGAAGRINRSFAEFLELKDAWPDMTSRELVLELVAIRNIVLHANSAGLGDGDEQPYLTRLKSRSVFEESVYGDWTVYQLSPLMALPYLSKAMDGIKAQYQYLKENLA